MALIIRTQTLFGEERDLYVRINNFEQLTNHSEAGADRVLFRGYISKEAFEQRRAFVWELALDAPVDVHAPVWSQAYEALKAYDPTLAIEPPLDPRIGLPDIEPGMPPLDETTASASMIAAYKKVEKSRARSAAMHETAEAQWTANLAEHDAAMAVAMGLRAALVAAADA